MKKRILSLALSLALLAGILLPMTTRAEAAGSKLIALTFDDGPGPYTARLLDGLKERGVKVTFFNLGQRAEDYPNTVRRIVAEGHQLASHTYSHQDLPSIGLNAAMEEINKTTRIFNQITGSSQEYFLRAPYGNTDPSIRSRLMSPVIYWSVDTEDWKYLNADRVRRNILNDAFDGAIILCHDIYSSTVSGALSAIDELQKQGYEFVTVRELYRRRGVQMQNGEIYYSCKNRGTDYGALAAPKITVTASGSGAQVTIESPSGAAVYYTLDGSAITYGASQYTGPIQLSAPCTIRAVAAYDLNGGRSAEASYAYSMPPATKAEIHTEEETLSFTGYGEGETVYYTLDGSDPRSAGIAYEGPVALTPGCWISFYTAGSGKAPTAVTRLFYSAQGNLFTDVDPEDWFYDKVDTAVSLHYMYGVGNYVFNPKGRLTRAMVVAIFFRMSGAEAPTERTNRFADVEDGAYYASAVEWAYENGVVYGVNDRSFQPNRDINRQEMAQMMGAFLKHMGVALPGNTAGAAERYGDRKQIAAWALPNVELVTSLGLMVGDEHGNFCPRDTATRAQCATVACAVSALLDA